MRSMTVRSQSMRSKSTHSKTLLSRTKFQPIRFCAHACAALLLPALLCACGAASTFEGWRKMESNVPDRTSVLVSPAPTLERDAAYNGYINRFALMALFSKVAYRHDLPQESRIGRGCAYLAGAVEKFGMPQAADGSGWRRMVLDTADQARGQVAPCYDDHGLYYETYLHADTAGGKADMAVIAFRGTENDSFSQQARDWSANLAAAVGIDPSEYRYARIAVTPLIERIRKDHPAAQIYVTGHSLGGGLAQQMAYVSDQVVAAFVFDSTPVTNWSQMMSMAPSPIHQPNPTIFRISHTHEVLHGIRTAATRFTSTRLNRADYEFTFQQEGRVGSHEMGILACHFALRVNVELADFHFPAAYFKEMAGNEAICPTKKGAVVLPNDLVDAKLKKLAAAL